MLKIATQPRTELGKRLKAVRAGGLTPAVAYGPKLKSASLNINSKDFMKLFHNVGYSKLLTVEVDGKDYKALVKEVQAHPVTKQLVHISFYVVDMDKEIEAEIPVEILGIAPAVKNNLGFLEVPSNTLAVRCLPADLPANIQIDISKLEQVGDAITAKDLGFTDKVKLVIALEHGEGSKIAFIAAPQKVVEEEVAPVVTEGEAGVEGAEGTAEAGAEAGATTGAAKPEAAKEEKK